MPRPPPPRRLGLSLIELLIVLSIAGTVVAIAFPRGQHAIDRLSVRAAAGDIAATLHSAHALALAGRAPVAVDVDAASGTLRVRRGSEVLFSRGIGHAHRVLIKQSRDSTTYSAWGLGRGAANLSIVVSRRAAVETVFVSRMGRVR
jgi:prepilin-type N-terminal cleavage/methylation domain-containing protein